jgi:SAM-dependent methyltransferase
MAATFRQCPICQYPSSVPFLKLQPVPVFCNVLYPSASAARRAPASAIHLVVCENCALIYNAQFEPALMQYSPGYTNPLDVSDRFRAFANELATKLVKNHALYGGRAVEIGCGNGFFLERLVEKGMKQGIGYDPSAKRREETENLPVQIFPKLIDLDHSLGPVDAFICRHVFEHLSDPVEFLSKLRAHIEKDDALIYFEVPNANQMLDGGMIWDVIYEHFTYWTSPALSTLFERHGFEPISVSTGFGKQFLMLEGRPSALPYQNSWPARADVHAFKKQCFRFGETSTKLISHWKPVLRNLRTLGRKVVLWGAGSKGITFANVVAGEEPLLAGIVDINPEKQGRYAALTGVPVLSPANLNDLRPDVILLMNENYTFEVTNLLNEIGVAACIQDISQVLHLAA